MLFLSNLTNLLIDISSIIAIKYIILDNLLYIIKITSFFAINNNFMIKFTVCIHSFSNTSFAIKFSTSAFV